MVRAAPAAFISGTAVNRRKPGLRKSALAELTKRFGVRPRLTWYDTYVTVDNLKGETRVNGKAIEAVA